MEQPIGDPGRVPDDAELNRLLGDDFESQLEGFVADGRGVVHDLSSGRRKVFGQPPPVVAIPVVDVPSVLGRRVVCVNEHGPIYDRRAASEVFTDATGSWIKVVEEWRWYCWLALPESTRPNTCPRATAWATANVWVEHYPQTA